MRCITCEKTFAYEQLCLSRRSLFLLAMLLGTIQWSSNSNNCMPEMWQTHLQHPPKQHRKTRNLIILLFSFLIRDAKRETFGSTTSLSSTQSNKVSGAGMQSFFYALVYTNSSTARRVGTAIARTFRQLRSPSPAPPVSIPDHQK